MLSEATTSARLAIFAAAVCVTHHLGLLTDHLGQIGPTSTNDWLDLLTPYLVVGCALWVLLSARPAKLDWLVAGSGAVVYVQGHALHLAANSIANAEPVGRAADAAHLWDEVVSHHLWYAGLTLIVVALARACRGRQLRINVLGWGLAIGVGLTYATNALGGGTAPASLVAALVLTTWGARRHQEAVGRVLLLTYGLGAAVLIGYGLRHGGWPPPD